MIPDKLYVITWQNGTERSTSVGETYIEDNKRAIKRLNRWMKFSNGNTEYYPLKLIEIDTTNRKEL